MGLNDFTFYDLIKRNAVSFGNQPAWYEVDDNDIIDDYVREDFIASMETEASGSIASLVNVDTAAFNGVLTGADSDVQTALETLDPINGVKTALQTGANVIMPNMTLNKYRASYDIYPGKAAGKQSDWRNLEHLPQALAKIDRTEGKSRGDSPNYSGRIYSLMED